MKKALIRLRNDIDRKLKFPDISKGDTALQIGFDMGSPNLTTDLFLMQAQCANSGLVVGIDPDPENIRKATAIIEKKGLNVKLVQRATASEEGTTKMKLGKRTSHNRLVEFSPTKHHIFSDDEIDVRLSPVDTILDEIDVPHESISHVNITNNGAEYETLLGMKRVLKESPDLSITVIAGRPGTVGRINDRPDYEVIQKYLNDFGFHTRFYRINKLIWGGLIHQTLIKGRLSSFFKKEYMGVVIAKKGNKKFRVTQSYS